MQYVLSPRLLNQYHRITVDGIFIAPSASRHETRKFGLGNEEEVSDEEEYLLRGLDISCGPKSTWRHNFKDMKLENSDAKKIIKFIVDGVSFLTDS